MPLTEEKLDIYVLTLSEAEGQEAFNTQKPIVIDGPNNTKITILISSESRQKPGGPVSFSGNVVVQSTRPASSSTNFSLSPKMIFIVQGDGLRILQGV